MKKLGSGGWRHIEERKREQLTLGGYSARTKADRCSGNYRPGAPARERRPSGGRAGMFHALGSQGWERVQDLERLGLLDTCIGLKIGACGWLCGSRRWATLSPPPSHQAGLRGCGWRANLPGAEAESGLRAPPAGPPGVPSAQPQRPNLRPGKTLPGKPRGVTSPSSVTSPPPGSRGVPAKEASLGLHRAPAGKSRGLQRAFTAPYVCPIGPARPRVRPARSPAGTMGRSGHRYCCPPPARAGLEPRRRQPPAAGPQVTLAAPGSVARARGHVEEPSVQ